MSEKVFIKGFTVGLIVWILAMSICTARIFVLEGKVEELNKKIEEISLKKRI